MRREESKQRMSLECVRLGRGCVRKEGVCGFEEESTEEKGELEVKEPSWPRVL